MEAMDEHMSPTKSNGKLKYINRSSQLHATKIRCRKKLVKHNLKAQQHNHPEAAPPQI